MQEGLLAQQMGVVEVDISSPDASGKSCCGEADFVVERSSYRNLIDNGDLITSTHIQAATVAPSTTTAIDVSSQLVGHINLMTSSSHSTRQTSNPIITGQDRNLNLQRADSDSSIEFDANSVRNTSSMDVEVSVGSEGREAPGEPPESSTMLPAALLHPCLPTLTPATPLRLAPDAAVVNSNTETAPPTEECDPAEIYPHHKKFRLHRKRAAALAAQNSAQQAQEDKSNTLTSHNIHDDSLTSDAKTNSFKSNATEGHEDYITPHTFPIETPMVTVTSPAPSSPLTSDFSDTENSLEPSEHRRRMNSDSSFDVSVRTPETETTSIGDECGDMDTSDVNFTYVERQVSSPKIHDDVFHAESKQSAGAVHECGWLQCSRQFACLDDLVNHVNDAHIRAERDVHYKCYWKNCPRRGKGFNARYKMLIHVRTHTNERPYKCNLCNKSFSRLENLKIHNRSHTGERPYVCPFEGCKKAYSNSSDRFKHVRTHQEQKPYSCRMPGCDKRYTDPSSLRKHIKTHGHYFRGATTEKSSGSSSTISQQENMNGNSGSVSNDFTKQSVPAKNLLTVPTSYLTPGFAATHPLLSPASQLQSSTLTTERLLELQARENMQNKALLEGQLFSGLSLPRHPLLGLGLPYSLPEAAHFTLSQSIPRSSASLLMPLAQNVNDTRSYLASLGSSGSLSPGHLSDSAHSVCTDNESCASPPLSYSRAGSQGAESPRRGSFSSHSPLLYPPVTVLSQSSESSHKHSAFSPVSPSTAPYSSELKYSLCNRSPQLVNRHPHRSPVHHPYPRPGSEYCNDRERSPPLRFPRADRPLDLSSTPESSIFERDAISTSSLSPPVASYPAFGLPLHCQTPPKCDLGPAFPALRLLNHA